MQTSVQYVGRLAPSPTGRIHLGIAQTSLAAWLDARARDGRLLLRIEDVDQGRVRAGAAEGIIEDLRWLGLDWDEGPDIGGARGPYAQSLRSDLYADVLADLERAGRTFACTCTRREIREASAPHGPSDEGPRYPGTCRNPGQTRPDRTSRSPAIRLRTQPGDHVRHHDRRLGSLREDVHGRVGDFILRRSDGLWAYQLAVTVDDLAQGVTCVVRGEDLWSSTGRQLLLRHLIRNDAPTLATLHVPLVYGPDGKRLAKRDGASSIAQLRAQGARPTEVVRTLADGLGLSPGGPVEPRALISQWVERFVERPYRDTRR